jgi:hypothetical protein
MVVGVIEVMAGEGGLLFPVCPPVLDEPPPQPEMNADTPRPRARTAKFRDFMTCEV